MAGTEEAGDPKELQKSNCFVWDETTQLFFHASTGFYHDPNAGWYYSSRDGLYYKFEKGNYVLLESHKVNECEITPCQGTATANPVHDDQCKQEYFDNKNHLAIRLDESEAHQNVKSGQDESTPVEHVWNLSLSNLGNGLEDRGFFEGERVSLSDFLDQIELVGYPSGADKSIPLPHDKYFRSPYLRRELMPGHTKCTGNQTPENPPPPSAWLEETLIDLYLSGYNGAVNADNGVMMSLETDEGDNFKFSADESRKNLDAESSKNFELEEGEWISEDHHGFTNASKEVLGEGVSWEEENWQSQYGQVVQSEEEPLLGFPVVELWDWSMVTECRKGGKDQVAKLVGHLVRRSAKLHPSMPSGGGVLKTAPICEVHLDLVRVTTGQVYKLRNPTAKYVASLSSYDSSNPTKEWGFPEFFPQSESIRRSKTESSDGITDCKDSSTSTNQLSAFEKHKSHGYRDRAAERRMLHGGIGVGPGQKSVVVGDDGRELSPDSTCAEDAAAEALEMSFGTGSYARRIMKGMGWKEGEALGNTTKGLVKPLEAIGNVGSAGLGWPGGKAKHR